MHLHVLRPEIEAIYLQIATFAVLKQTVQFSGDIVALLTYRDRLEDFVRLYALKFIDLKGEQARSTLVCVI